MPRINAEAVYTLRHPTPSPFLAVNANTVWNVPHDEEHPLQLRGSAGLSVGGGGPFTARVGLAVERDLPAERTQLGLELAPALSLRLPQGAELRSTAAAFLASSAPRRVSVESHTSLSVALWGKLRATAHVHQFVRWDDDVDQAGLRTEFQVGLAHAWDARWAR